MNQPDHHQTVTMGSWVKVREEGAEEVELYHISAFTNVRQNRIAVDNALGKALLGAKPGDEITVAGRTNPIKFQVLEVGRED
jgi:transcription elongation GreA/GreB family factor